MARTRVFVSYSRKDKARLDELRVHLASLESQLDVWDDTRLTPGKRWLPQLEAALAEARLAVLLVSPDFLASPFITQHEVPALLSAAEAADVPLLCIYVRPALVKREYSYDDPVSGERQTAQLPEFQALNDPAKPLSKMRKPERESALVEIAEKILAAAETAGSAAPRVGHSPDGQARAAAGRAADPRPYFEKLRDQTRRLDLRGIAAAQARRIELERVYTRLRVNPPAGGDGEGPRGRRGLKRGEHPGEREPPAVELKDLLREHANLVLVGDPGAGKTTFLRFAALNLARAWLDDERDACLERLGLTGEPPFPVLVSLGGFGQFLEKQPSAESPAESPEQFYRHLDFLARGFHPDLPDDFLRARVRAGRCLLLLDGLDEVPGEGMRRRVGAILDQVVASGRERGNRHVVTCRTRAWQGRTRLGPDFVPAALLDFGWDEVEQFVTQWSRALHSRENGGVDTDEADAHGRSLLAAIQAHPHVRPLTANPLLLTILALVHWNLRRLPEGRAELYKVALDHLLRAREEHSEQPVAMRRHGLKEIARRMFEEQQGVRKSLDRREAADAVAPVLGLNDAEALAFVEDEELYSGILVSRSEGEVEFWHPTFGEYLAAEALAAERDCWKFVGRHVFDPRWNEVVLLLAGCLLVIQGPRFAAAFIRQILAADASLPGRARAAGLVGRILRDLLPYRGDPARGTGYAEALAEMPLIFEKGSDVPEAVRVEVGEALGLAGDARIPDDDHAGRVFLKGGTFWMGAQKEDRKKPGYDPDAYDDEAPVHRVTVSGFWIDRYPVTVAQYRRFVDAAGEGYLDARFWRPEGWRRREAEKWTGPREWEEQLRHLNRPVTRVSWYEADAYCAWLSATTKQRVSLPTEAQWEYAARGAVGRKFPWGNEEPTDRHANFDMHVGRPTPVGIYPLGATPEGLQDLSGNVLEWCLDWWANKYPSREQTDPAGPREGQTRLRRGGAFSTSAGYCRGAYRGRDHPGYAYDYVGFRCVVLRREDSND